MQKAYKNSKAGISLITVLLFMMIATIAATATYKWITSEGRSRASRMLQREAYQSSIAGIENARAWMTYHANDVGALIKAYIDGGNKPVNIDDRLRTLQRAGQDYHVWLVGVNTEESTYKLKILSSGEARNNTRHSEVAIFNVDGLYRVKVPQEKKSGEVDFNEAFFGSAKEGISLDVSSAIMNGNTKFNTKFEASDYVIVTGDVSVNSSTDVGDLYVKGNLYSCTNFNVHGDAYVEDTMYLNGTHSYDGDIYAKGGMDLSGKGTGKAQCSTGPGGGITVAGNVSAEADIKMPRHNAPTKYIFNGNLILKNGAKLDFPTVLEYSYNAAGGLPYQVHFYGNVYLDGGINNGWFMGYKRAGQVVLSSEGKNFYSSTPVYRISDKNQNIVYSWWKKNNNEHQDTDISGDKNGLYATDKSGNSYKLTAVPKNTFCNQPNCQPTDDFSNTYFWDNVHFYCNEWESKTYCNGTQTLWGCNGSLETYQQPKNCGSDCKWELQKANVGDRNGYRWKCSNMEGLPKQRNEVFMQVNGTYVTSKPDTNGWGANRMQDYEDKITNENTGEGCGTTNHVKDPIQFNKELLTHEKLHSESNKGACKDLTLWNSWPNPSGWFQLNDCYQKAKAVNELYDDNWLLIKLERPQWATNSSDFLQGNFIIIVEGTAHGNGIYLPQTKSQIDGSKSNVLFYFPSGFDAIINSSGGSNPMNYFIFSDGDLKNVQLSSSTINGSIFLTDCHNMGSDQTIKIQYNGELTENLAGSGIICNNDGTNSCGSGSPSGSGGSGSDDESISKGGDDSYYVSMAPQLGISLESQYENNESLPIANNETELDPSFIVLPRVIYLPSDPYGSLPDYYNILPLNGSTLKKEDVNVNCSGIPTTGKLYSGTTLAKGIFKCTAAANNHDNVPFWVVIGDDQRSTPAINFVEPSHEMPASGSHEVKVNVPAHDQPIKLNVSCPSAPENWSYSLASGTNDGNGKCIFDLPPNNASSQVTLFTVTTTSAASGTLVFNLLSGEGYNLTSPYSAELHVSSNATLNRIKATLEDIKTYCTNSPENCPAEDLLNEWPDCNIEETWVEPSTNFGVNTRNNSWAISVGGTGEVRLNPVNNDKCIIIIPQEGNSLELSTLEVNKTYTLKASIKRKKRSVKVGFKGEIDGKNPVLDINAGGRTSQCAYGDLSDDKTCTISVFDGETISLSIDKENNTENEQFSYWKCASGSCPTTEPITSNKYNDFSVSDNETVIYAYFNEQDKHCFFEEFKENSLECSNDETEYCIDYCDGTCSGTSGGEYSKAKWHLVAGSINDVSKDYDYIRIKESIGKKGKDGSAVKVLSTVNAGLYGTMKALFQLPKATSNYGTASANISQSGFMLRSNNSATEYLMLNLYVDENGKLAAQLCTENRNNCASQFLRNSSDNEASVSTSNMIMMSATLSAENLIVSAFTGNYYGDPTEYTTTFDMKDFSNYGDRAHEFVGFSLADENFKLYGIGWKSEDYASECHDTYPTVKCSFAAVAENGIIPTEKTVKPWVGHSGWFDSESCTEKYYYYNGTDACGGTESGSVECSSAGYSFSESGAGVHGYLEGEQEIKTAKAWLDCTPSSEKKYAWATETEIERAHCGLFWTGKISECVDDTELFSGELTVSNEEKSIPFNSKANLRGTTLNIELENTDNAEVEIWLLSENDKWGSDDFESTPVKMSNNSASFEVEKTFSDGAEGFDPENVTAIVLKTTGYVVLKSVTTKCKNTIGISNCNAEYNKELSKWIITADITNKDKVNSYNVVGSVDGSSVFSISAEPSWNDNQATFEHSHNPYISNQGKTYSITASITQGTITKETTSCGERDIGKITCSDAKIDGNATIESGSKYPTFSFKLNECPNEGCPYEIYLNDTKQHSDEGTVSLNYTAPGTAPECENDNGCEYTYKVKSATNSNYPFDPCSTTFKVVKKVEPIGLSCTDFANLTGKETSSSISITPTVSNCDGGCTYDIKLNGISVSDGDYSTDPISFIGASVAGTKNYTLSMTRTNDNVTESCNFSVEYSTTNVKTECYFSNSNYQPGANAEFKVTVNKNGYDISNRDYELRTSSGKIVASGLTGTNQELSINPSGENTIKDEIFYLYVKNNDNFELSCTANLDVNDLSPTCKKVTENGIDYFQFSFNQICADNACSYNVKKTYNNTTTSITDGNKTLSQNDTKVKMTGFGNYVLWLNGEETACQVNIEEPDPAFTCPTNLQAIAGKENNVTITPSGVSGCDNGCSYTIAGTSVTSSTFEYHYGALPTFTNSTTAVGNTATYEVSLTNNKTTVKHDCEVTFVAESVTPVDNPGIVACYSDGNYNWGSSSVKIKIDNHDGTYSNKSYDIKDASGSNSLATGTTGTNQQIEIQMSSYYATDSKLRVFIAGSEVCSVTPRVKKPYLKDCKANGSDKVHFQIEQCDNSKCKYQVKKGGTPVNEETYGSGGIDVSVSGNGLYVVWLNGEETSCRVPIGTTMSVPAHCYFPQARKWGEQESQLKMDNPGHFMSGKTYVVKDAANNIYAESSNNTSNNVVDINLDKKTYYATDVTLYVYVGTTQYCAVEPLTYGPYAYNCYMESNQKFKFGIGDCGNNKCSYVIKRDGTTVKTQNNVGENGGYEYSVSDAGTYVLWLNGHETGCRVTRP